MYALTERGLARAELALPTSSKSSASRRWPCAVNGTSSTVRPPPWCIPSCPIVVQHESGVVTWILLGLKPE